MSVKQVSKELSVIEKRTGVQQLSAQKKVNKQQVNKKQVSNKQEKSKVKKKEARDEQRRVKIKWAMKWEKTSEHQTRKTKTSEKQTSK